MSSDIAAQVREWIDRCTILPGRFKTPHFKGKVINNELALRRLAKKMRHIDEYAFDCETTGFRVKMPGCDEIVGLAISWGKENNYYIPINHLEYLDQCIPIEKVVKALKPIFERTDITLIGHNPE